MVASLPITEVAAALGPGMELIGLDFRRGHPTWVCRPQSGEVGDTDLAAGVEAALGALIPTTAQEFEIREPWSVVLSLDRQVSVARWGRNAEQEAVEPILTDLLARVNP